MSNVGGAVSKARADLVQAENFKVSTNSVKTDYMSRITDVIKDKYPGKADEFKKILNKEIAALKKIDRPRLNLAVDRALEAMINKGMISRADFDTIKAGARELKLGTNDDLYSTPSDTDKTNSTSDGVEKSPLYSDPVNDKAEPDVSNEDYFKYMMLKQTLSRSSQASEDDEDEDPGVSIPNLGQVADKLAMQVAFGTTDMDKIGMSSGPAGFLWKPKSESDGNLVVLLPTEVTGQVAGIRVVSPDGAELASGRFSAIANGGREHYRFAQSGDSFPAGSVVEISMKDGTTNRVVIEKTGSRNEQRHLQ